MDNGSVRTGSDGRDGRGLFAPGNKIAKGNVMARRMAELRQVALDTETPEQVSEVFVRLRELALEGDVAAAKTYLTFTIGRPPQALELSGPEGSPLGLDVHAIQTVILSALAGPQYADARIALAGELKKLAADARDAT